VDGHMCNTHDSEQMANELSTVRRYELMIRKRLFSMQSKLNNRQKKNKRKERESEDRQ